MLKPAIITKRIYEKPDPNDGFRVLVDRMWPRGIKKKKANMDLWLKDLGPSVELRKWFSHDPKKWSDFKKRYFQELAGKQNEIKKIIANQTNITLLYGSKEKFYNNATALKEFMEKNF